jgi:hypothetical protein
MKKLISVTLALMICCFTMIFNPYEANAGSYEANAGYCYAKFNGEICDLNNPANCIEECKVVEEVN